MRYVGIMVHNIIFLLYHSIAVKFRYLNFNMLYESIYLFMVNATF